jgi:hypothetical protein
MFLLEPGRDISSAFKPHREGRKLTVNRRNQKRNADDADLADKRRLAKTMFLEPERDILPF